MIEIVCCNKRMRVGSMQVPRRKKPSLVLSVDKGSSYTVLGTFSSDKAAKAFEDFLNLVVAASVPRVC